MAGIAANRRRLEKINAPDTEEEIIGALRDQLSAAQEALAQAQSREAARAIGAIGKAKKPRHV